MINLLEVKYLSECQIGEEISKHGQTIMRFEDFQHSGFDLDR